jgi:aminoglycoside phosphotransferase family enzyme/predicted kinase
MRNPLKTFTNQQQLIAALRDPRRYTHAAKNVRVIETHISWVLLAGAFVYKIKKAVNLGFLDYTELAARKFCCDEEIRLNRRTAPDIYLDTVAIGGSADAPQFGALPAIEYAVRMRRFPAGKLMDSLLMQERVTAQHIDALAAAIFIFHASIPSVAAESELGTAEAVRAAALQNFEQLAVQLDSEADRANIAVLLAATEAEFAACKPLFDARRVQGFVRECHGDLHLGNIVLVGDKPVLFDCIEFNPALRWVDVMSELAFTVMDLLHRNHGEFAWRLLNAYLEASGDYAGLAVLRFYLAYRATVRAKVSAIRSGQSGISQRAKSNELSACRSYLALTSQCLAQRRPALVPNYPLVKTSPPPCRGRAREGVETLSFHSSTPIPTFPLQGGRSGFGSNGLCGLIITHGLPGSGKTTFSQLALQQLGAIRIRSDVERKRLFGLGSLDNSHAHGAEIYSAQATQQTYTRLLELARELLAVGFVVIVDAAFLRREEREMFQHLALSLSSPFAIASLHAPHATLRARIQQRSNDASEADVNVLEMLQAAQQPLSRQERVVTAKFSTAEAPDSESNLKGWFRLSQKLGIL